MTGVTCAVNLYVETTNYSDSTGYESRDLLINSLSFMAVINDIACITTYETEVFVSVMGSHRSNPATFRMLLPACVVFSGMCLYDFSPFQTRRYK